MFTILPSDFVNAKLQVIWNVYLPEIINKIIKNKRMKYNIHKLTKRKKKKNRIP